MTIGNPPFNTCGGRVMDRSGGVDISECHYYRISWVFASKMWCHTVIVDEPMADISIEVWDATGNKKQLVQLPAAAAVNRVVAVLVQKMNLPQHSPDGQLMSYKFQHRPTGRQLLDTETLASAGVRDGDIVRLQPEITAGCAPIGRDFPAT